MDRSHWMYRLKRLDDGYLVGLAGFLKAAEKNRVKKRRKLHICDENSRTSVLKSCNEKGRTYKKSITRKLSTNGGDPWETWSYLEEADLQIFRQRISTDEFQVSLDLNTNPNSIG